ESV
ncbi:unnamed protein product, partial [Diplocarpon coronariae]